MPIDSKRAGRLSVGCGDGLGEEAGESIGSIAGRRVICVWWTRPSKRPVGVVQESASERAAVSERQGACFALPG